MKRITAITATLLLTACATAKHPAELRETQNVYRLLDTDITPGEADESGDDSKIVLHFKSVETGETLDEHAETYGTNGQAEVKRVMHALDWLNVGDCYIQPMSQTEHKEVSCG